MEQIITSYGQAHNHSCSTASFASLSQSCLESVTDSFRPEFSDLTLQQLAQHTATADSMMHAAPYAKAHTVHGSYCDATPVHVYQCTTIAVS